MSFHRFFLTSFINLLTIAFSHLSPNTNNPLTPKLGYSDTHGEKDDQAPFLPWKKYQLELKVGFYFLMNFKILFRLFCLRIFCMSIAFTIFWTVLPLTHPVTPLPLKLMNSSSLSFMVIYTHKHPDNSI